MLVFLIAGLLDELAELSFAGFHLRQKISDDIVSILGDFPCLGDYRLDNTYFSGYFGDSNTHFRMSKLTDYYYWTPTMWIESGWYGYDVYYDNSYYSKQFEGTAKSKSVKKAPVIVKQGRNRSHAEQ